MKETIISFETAKLAKEKGFNYKTYHNYNKKGKLAPNSCTPSSESPSINRGYYSAGTIDADFLCQNTFYEIWKDTSTEDTRVFLAPTQSLLQKWLRETHNIHLVCWWYDQKDKFYTELGRKDKDIIRVQTGNTTKLFKTYEEALEEGLLEALKLIK